MGEKSTVQPLTPERLHNALTRDSKKPRKPKGRGGFFLKGPVPIQWLGQAAQLGGKCLAVGVVLWFLCGLKRTNTVAVEHKWLAVFGVARDAASRCLHQLENAGLIAVRRRPGCSPIVTVSVGEPEEVARVD